MVSTNVGTMLEKCTDVHHDVPMLRWYTMTQRGSIFEMYINQYFRCISIRIIVVLYNLSESICCNML